MLRARFRRRPPDLNRQIIRAITSRIPWIFNTLKPVRIDYIIERDTTARNQYHKYITPADDHGSKLLQRRAIVLGWPASLRTSDERRSALLSLPTQRCYPKILKPFFLKNFLRKASELPTRELSTKTLMRMEISGILIFELSSDFCYGIRYGCRQFK